MQICLEVNAPSARPTEHLAIQRFQIASTRTFEEVVGGLNAGIGRSAIRLTGDPPTVSNSAAARPAPGLMQFLRLDLGFKPGQDPIARVFEVVRVFTGDRLALRQSPGHTPAAASDAPITILVYEHEGAVHLSYETLAATSSNQLGLAAAEHLDKRVMDLLVAAA